MIEIKPPSREKHNFKKAIFLAGSIEMGTAEDWQTKIIKDLYTQPIAIYNPRRDDWDSSWEQDINTPNFYEQVNWELDMLDKADIIFMYFDPTTKSPISLLELGLYADKCGNDIYQHMIVCCPQGFWRKGNVDIVCQRYGIPVFDNFDTALIALKAKLS
jgi:hypothetical protein